MKALVLELNFGTLIPIFLLIVQQNLIKIHCSIIILFAN